MSLRPQVLPSVLHHGLSFLRLICRSFDIVPPADVIWYSQGDDVINVLRGKAVLSRSRHDFLQILCSRSARVHYESPSHDVRHGSELLALQKSHCNRLPVISLFVAIQFFKIRWAAAIEHAQYAIAGRHDVGISSSVALQALKDQPMICQASDAGTILSMVQRTGARDHLVCPEIAAVGEIPYVHERASWHLPLPYDRELLETGKVKSISQPTRISMQARLWVGVVA
jgi:hypothetical protein